VKYLVLTLTVFGVNLLPAFGPPTWAVLVFARLRWHLNPVALVALGVSAAAIGRYLLALAARHFSARLPARLRDNLEEARALIERKRVGVLALFGVFVVSPLPSAQLFLAAGLLELPLGLLTVAFVLGRVVSYSIYVSLATIADRQLSSVVQNAFGSWWSLSVQVVFLVIVCVLPFVDWRRIAQRRATSSAARRAGPR
jgi:membrane protein YqaA with SNARE-associated domain